MNKYETKGYRRTIWVPKKLDRFVEEARTHIGLTRSGFYRHAILRLLQELDVLPAKAKEVKMPDVNQFL